MSVKQAIAERNIKPNERDNRAGVTPSSVYRMLEPRRLEQKKCKSPHWLEMRTFEMVKSMV